MTPEELAMHWKTSLENVKKISNIVNYLYYAAVIQGNKETSNTWKAVLYAYDGKKNYVLMEEGRNFSDKDQAIVQGTKWAQNIKISSGQAKLMGFPEDAHMALRPIVGYEKALQNIYISLKKKKSLKTYQRH